jgi:hypothetical protein
MNQQHNVSMSGGNPSQVDCSCGLKNQTAINIANHLKQSLVAVVTSPADAEGTSTSSRNFIRHIELATGKKYVKLSGQDFYISPSELAELTKQEDK